MYYYIYKDESIRFQEDPIDTKLFKNFVQMTDDQISFMKDNPKASVYEIKKCKLYTLEDKIVDQLEYMKKSKISEINLYASSKNINEFFYKNRSCWIDKNKRTYISNTLNYCQLLGRNKVNIWIDDDYLVELSIDSAKKIIAIIEVYASDCYDITQQHKLSIRNMNNIDDINQFDIKLGYPNKPSF